MTIPDFRHLDGVATERAVLFVITPSLRSFLNDPTVRMSDLPTLFQRSNDSILMKKNRKKIKDQIMFLSIITKGFIAVLDNFTKSLRRFEERVADPSENL